MVVVVIPRTQNWVPPLHGHVGPWQLPITEVGQNSEPLAQSGSGQGGNRSVPKKERETHGVDFRVVNWLLYHPKNRRRPCHCHVTLRHV